MANIFLDGFLYRMCKYILNKTAPSVFKMYEVNDQSVIMA